MSESKLIVVGGGLAGLMATIKACEKGQKVDLFSLCPVKRSHSLCAQGGINGALNTKGENDSVEEHFDDTIYGGDFLANQKPVRDMCYGAPNVIHMFDRMGVMFSRTLEGLIDLRRFGGTKNRRTAFAGATTGQQLLYATDEQVRKYEVAGLVTKYEFWDMQSAIIDDEGVCRGIVAQNMNTMEMRSFKGDAVVVATGGLGMIFGKSTNSTICTGSAAGALYQQGVHFANGEFIQIHPTAVPGDDKLRLMSEAARGEGGRVWTYKDGKPWYFLEEMFPAYGNLVPRDIATRAIFSVCVDQGLGVNGENKVYLDLSHIDAKELDRKLGGILDIYEKFAGDDPRKVPMMIFPGVHYTMGGIYTNYGHMTNVPGLFTAGECDYSYHGANRLGANSLLSAVFSGMEVGPKAADYIKGLKKSANDLSSTIFERELKRQQKIEEDVINSQGTENPFKLHEEMGKVMTENVTVVRENDRIAKTEGILVDLMERYKKIGLSDTGVYSNQSLLFSKQLWNMMNIARVITKGALLRNESRGSHYKPEFPDRNDEDFLKTTMAKYTPDGPEIWYEDVDTSLIKPRPRRYDVDKEVK